MTEETAGEIVNVAIESQVLDGEVAESISVAKEPTESVENNPSGAEPAKPMDTGEDLIDPVSNDATQDSSEPVEQAESNEETQESLEPAESTDATQASTEVPDDSSQVVEVEDQPMQDDSSQDVEVKDQPMQDDSSQVVEVEDQPMQDDSSESVEPAESTQATDNQTTTDVSEPSQDPSDPILSSQPQSEAAESTDATQATTDDQPMLDSETTDALAATQASDSVEQPITSTDGAVESDDGEITDDEKVEEKSEESKREKDSKRKDKKKHKTSKHKRRSRSRSPSRHHRRSRSSSPVEHSSSRQKNSSPSRSSRDNNGHTNGNKHQSNGDSKRRNGTTENDKKDMFKSPALLQSRCQQVVQIGENQAAQISDHELRTYIKEVVTLERELDKYHHKRDLLKNELQEMSKREMDLIKKIHSEMPRHMQSVLRIDGNSVHIERANGAPGGAGFPFGMMPPPPFAMPPGMMPPMDMKFPPPFPPPAGMFRPPPNFHMGHPPPFAMGRGPPPNIMHPPPKIPTPENRRTPPIFSQPPPIAQQGGFPDFSKPPPIPPIMEKGGGEAAKENATKSNPTRPAAVSTPPFRGASGVAAEMAEKSNKLTSMLTNALKAHVTQRPQSPFGNGSPSSTSVAPKPAVPSLMSVPIREPPNLRGIPGKRKRMMEDE